MIGQPPNPSLRGGDAPPPPPPSERDWQQLIDYLAGEAPPLARLALEHRLATDPAFAAFAASVGQLWQTPLPFPPRDTAAGWLAVQRKAAARRTMTDGGGRLRMPTRHRLTPTPSWVRQIRHAWSSPRRWSALAAVLLLGVVGTEVVRRQLYPAYYYKSSTVATAVTLPDGSHALLAPGSYLGTDHGFPTRTRTVYLFGQAHFNIAPHPRVPFVVTVPGVGARVLGTTFTLRADTTPAVQIAVDHGAVAVETRDATGQWHTMQVLTAGEAVHVSRLETWLAQAGDAIAGAGVPFREAMHLGIVLRNAAVRAGAAQAARQK